MGIIPILHLPSTSPLALCHDEPRPTRPAAICLRRLAVYSRYRKWQGPNGLGSQPRSRSSPSAEYCASRRHVGTTKHCTVLGIDGGTQQVQRFQRDHTLCFTETVAEVMKREQDELLSSIKQYIESTQMQETPVFQQRRSQIGSASMHPSLPCNGQLLETEGGETTTS